VDRLLKLSSPATRECWPIPVLWEDEHLLALDKPAGLLTSPDRQDPGRPSLIGLLHQGIARGTAWARERQLRYLTHAHRLGSEITGVLLLARSKPALIALANQLGSRQVARTYLALVCGRAPQDRFDVEAPLSPDPGRPGAMRVDHRQGKAALTRFSVLERFTGHTWLQCELTTERTDQIRVHLCRVGLPIAGDARYGGPPLLLSQLKSHYRLKPHRTERPLTSRAALHASGLQLRHPVTGAPLQISAPLPRDLAVALKYLRRYATGAALGAQESPSDPTPV
jgi:23S rRNA pseudouridine1911/1915/1917 synthase